MDQSVYNPPWGLHNGMAMTLYVAFRMSRIWQAHTADPEPPYQSQTFSGAGDVPLYGKVAVPANPRGTIVATYGITGSLDNQWFLTILGRKAYAQGYAVVLFDWRAHGKTAELSPALTSDGLYEGEDFVRIAAAAKAMGCPAPFWFAGYSLGGQLVLWAVKAAETVGDWGSDLGLTTAEVGGGAVICPSLDSERSLTWLAQTWQGRSLDRAITKELKVLATRIYGYHPHGIDPEAIARVQSIWTFDQELVIGPLGFPSVPAYYAASSPLPLLPTLTTSTLILYAADDPMFDPTLVADLQAVCANHRAIDLVLTPQGGHVGYLSSKACQQQWQDSDPWWAWNRILDWFNARSPAGLVSYQSGSRTISRTLPRTPPGVTE